MKLDGESMLAEAMQLVAVLQSRVIHLAGENGALKRRMEELENGRGQVAVVEGGALDAGGGAGALGDHP